MIKARNKDIRTILIFVFLVFTANFEHIEQNI